MKKCILLAFGFLLFLSKNAYPQEYSNLRFPDPPKQRTKFLPAKTFMDGLPSNYNDIDPKIIQSISISKDTLFDYSGKAVFRGYAIIASKDSKNTGLKYILNKTNNWIFSHPLAQVIVNGKNVEQDLKSFNKVYQSTRFKVINIQIIEPDDNKTEYKDGALLLKIK